MATTEERLQFFFDESGKSDLSSAQKSGQANLILAGMLINWQSDFWEDVKPAWQSAAKALGKAPAEVELHGWELYGSKGQWAGCSTPLPTLALIFAALKKHKIPIYWTGVPVDGLKAVQNQVWERILVTYLDLLHQKLSTSGLAHQVEVYGDENSWTKANRALKVDTWTSFKDKQAGFLNSHQIHGLQLADVVAHTLYRSNKTMLSNTDKTANEFRLSIATQIIHVSEG